MVANKGKSDFSPGTRMVGQDFNPLSQAESVRPLFLDLWAFILHKRVNREYRAAGPATVRIQAVRFRDSRKGPWLRPFAKGPRAN